MRYIMMFCLFVVMWPVSSPEDYLVFLASWSTSGRSLSLSSCSFLSFLALAFSCSVFLVFEEEEEKEVFFDSLILFTWNMIQFHIIQAWRRHTATRQFSLRRPVLKFPSATSTTCCSAGTLASPNQKVRTVRMTEERRARTKRRSPS